MNGIRILFREEHNARIHLFIALCVMVLAYFLNISSSEWIVILLSFALVFSFELINSSIENLADFISIEKQPAIKKVKDLAAAAVLVSAIAASIIGIIIFLPKIIMLLSH